MEFRTPVTIDKSPFTIAPCERMLFVGSCFADNIGSRFVDDKFRATVNPYGVMYNPASILHTVERYLAATTAEVARTAVFTLGTNRAQSGAHVQAGIGEKHRDRSLRSLSAAGSRHHRRSCL